MPNFQISSKVLLTLQRIKWEKKKEAWQTDMTEISCPLKHIKIPDKICNVLKINS